MMRQSAPGGVVPPPQTVGDQQPTPQQWMMMHQQRQAPPQPVPPPTQMQQYQAAQGTEGTVEIRSLWIADLQEWMDENYLTSIFAHTGEVLSAEVIHSRHTGRPKGYGFIQFVSRAAAERVLQTFNGTTMPNTEQAFRLNWAALGLGEKHQDKGPNHTNTIFVGDLAADVTDCMLQETFKAGYPSVKGAKVVTDRTTGQCKGYGFVKFSDENEQIRAMTEMNGMLCSTRPMRVGPAANKKPLTTQQYPKAPCQNKQGELGENDPNNTTVFVGFLDPSVTEDQLKQVFGQVGELVHVKIPVGKHCGFVQFANRTTAEQALSVLNGTVLGGRNIRLSWGRSPSSKQGQSDQTQGNCGCYGYQGYEAYGYVPSAQGPNMYYGGYTGFGNYQRPGAYQQPQQ